MITTPLLSPTDFKQGIYAIPNVSHPDMDDSVSSCIRAYERIIVRRCFGGEIAKEIYSENPPQWLPRFKEILPYFLYYYIVQDISQVTTEIGVASGESDVATKTDFVSKACTVWNTGVELLINEEYFNQKDSEISLKNPYLL